MQTNRSMPVLLARFAALVLGALPAMAQDDRPVVAAASDLHFAVAEIAEAFSVETSMQVRLIFGSTGNFSRQIREGAPFEMYMAADESFVAGLHAEGLTRDEGDLYALGRVVLVAPNGSSLTPDESLDNLAQMLAEGTITRFAIANPDHAPYGMRAMESLITKGIWDDLQPVMVLGENVSQAAQFALSGNAEGGIIAYSLALAPEVADLGEFAVIPHDWHAPLRQRMALLDNAGPVAEAFYAYMQRSPAREIMARYGFVLPEGT